MTDDNFTALQTLLHKRARALIACPHEAADLAQDAVLKLWQQHCHGTKPDDLQAYAMTTLRNLARSRWRDRKPMQQLHEDMATTAPDALGRIACNQLQEALTRLPKTQSDLMVLVATGETSPASLARITGQPLGTVMSRLARARATLRKDLGLGRTTPVRDLFVSPRDA